MHHHSKKNIRTALILNLGFSLIELIGGIFTGSIAVLADALHDFGDSITLAIALYLENFAQKKPSPQFSYGYKRFSLLSSVISALILIGGSLFVIAFSIFRFQQPHSPQSEGMMGLALLGIIANGWAALKLSKGNTQNEKVLTWHLLEDLFGWAVLLIGAIVIKITQWTWIDPLLAIFISTFIVWNVLKHFRYSIVLFLQGSPHTFNQKDFINTVIKLKGVLDLHDIHVWSLDGVHNILSCHLILEKNITPQQISKIKENVREIASSHGEFHLTIETEEDPFFCGDHCQ